MQRHSYLAVLFGAALLAPVTEDPRSAAKSQEVRQPGSNGELSRRPHTVSAANAS